VPEPAATEIELRTPVGIDPFGSNPAWRLLNGRKSGSLKLPLAARRCVGHIGRNGAVAEWLKAAVC
jgi:hypothetical protein